MILLSDLTSINRLRSILEKSTLFPEPEGKRSTIEVLPPLSYVLGESRKSLNLHLAFQKRSISIVNISVVLKGCQPATAMTLLSTSITPRILRHFQQAK